MTLEQLNKMREDTLTRLEECYKQEGMSAILNIFIAFDTTESGAYYKLLNHLGGMGY